ncbi:hypothetical protein B0G77_6324 [Paraburkholderia sp. BL10I2N1]|nr:hypothetical protein B0G77_6324 [Paraburkholderia sp. BL10I2N1]
MSRGTNLLNDGLYHAYSGCPQSPWMVPLNRRVERRKVSDSVGTDGVI